MIGVPDLPAGWSEAWTWGWTAPERGRGVMARASWWTDEAGRRVGRTEYFVRLWIVAAWAVLMASIAAGVFVWPTWWWLAAIPLAVAPALVTLMVVRHERGHANGIPATGCVGGHLWCVMAEESMLDETEGWRAKARLLVYQVWGLGRYCRDCRQVVYPRD